MSVQREHVLFLQKKQHELNVKIYHNHMLEKILKQDVSKKQQFTEPNNSNIDNLNVEMMEESADDDLVIDEES